MPAAVAPIIGAAIGGFFASAVGIAVIQIGLGLAISALARSLGPKPKGQTGGGIRTKVTLEGGALPQTLMLGRYATSGAYVAPPYAHGHLEDVPNAWRTTIVDLADHRVTALRKFWIDGTDFTVGTDTTGSLTAYSGAKPAFATRPKWSVLGLVSRFEVHFRDGSQSTADPRLVALFGGRSKRPWTSAMVGRGVAYAWFDFRWSPKVFQGEPQLKFELDGATLYDRRLDTTAGGAGAQRADDEATWAFTENPIVMVEAILRGIPLEDGTVWGLGVAAEDLPLAAWSAAASHCDTLVEGAPRYRAGYEARMATAEQGGDEPFDVVEELLKACAGGIADCGGLWTVRAGPPGLPVAFLTDDDVVVSRPQEHEPHGGVAEVHNAVRATFPDPAQGWAEREAPLRVDAAAEAEDGERLVADLALPAVWHEPQVQRLQVALLKDARRMRRHTITLPPEFSGILPLDVVAWSSERNGYDSKLFEVGEVGIEPRTLAVTLALREVDPADFDWDPGDLLAGPAAEPERDLPDLVLLTGVTVAPATVGDSTGAARRPAVLFSWPATLAGVGSLTWELRVQATGAPATSGSTTHVEAGETTVSDGILPSTTYEARLKADTSDWSSWMAVATGAEQFVRPDIAVGAVSDIYEQVAAGPWLTDTSGPTVASIDLGAVPSGSPILVAFVAEARSNYLPAAATGTTTVRFQYRAARLGGGLGAWTTIYSTTLGSGAADTAWGVYAYDTILSSRYDDLEFRVTCDNSGGQVSYQVLRNVHLYAFRLVR